MSEFIEWVHAEMKNRGIGNNELATRGALPPSSVSDILNGKMRISYKFCRGIAKVFGIPIEDVLIKAQMLPPPVGDTERLPLRELWAIVRGMDDRQLLEVRRYARYLASTEHNADKSAAENESTE